MRGYNKVTQYSRSMCACITTSHIYCVAISAYILVNIFKFEVLGEQRCSRIEPSCLVSEAVDALQQNASSTYL